MKRFFRISLWLLLLALTACTHHTIIPDKKLAQIFHDVFLTNAYLSIERVDADSLKIYEPIFSKYGYTTEDVYYTIGNFSKRKSARLGNVVERSITMLEAEGTVLNREVAALDTIDNVARRKMTRPVLQDSLIRVGALRDTSRLKLSVDVVPGEYMVRFEYLIDSLDRNDKGLMAVFWLEKADSTRSSVYSTLLRRGRQESFNRRFLTDSTHRSLHMDFLDFRAKPQRPSVTITDLEVNFTPPTEVAVDELYQQQLGIRIFDDEFLRIPGSSDSL